MSEIQWGLVTCPDHQDQLGAVLAGDLQTISAARAGCFACRITLTCPACGWTSRHMFWSGAHAAAGFHTKSCDPTRKPTW